MELGLFQSFGWPCVVAIVRNWFGKSKRGSIIGVWNSHTSVGNIVGSVLASAVLEFGWGWSFVLPGLGIIFVGVVDRERDIESEEVRKEKTEMLRIVFEEKFLVIMADENCLPFWLHPYSQTFLLAPALVILMGRESKETEKVEKDEKSTKE
ncbi:Major facilitator superfamily [Dillenia turbinata]|uniref:Major facilitator superfamily n=1 Tax=Dillenia turbinata TaxID=194707 RepID=A0AAN8Z1Z1_9MAGN